MIARTPADEHFTHRLAAFSDIVIGFSLAQLGANLVLTPEGQKIFTDPGRLFAFLFPFAIICSLWFVHHRFFSAVFVPKTWPVILNFLWLAAVVLLVFAAEAYSQEKITLQVARAYFACYAFVYALLAVQNLIGLRYARERHDDFAASRAVRGAVFMGIWTFPFLWALSVLLLRPSAGFGATVWLGFIVPGVLSPILGRRLRRVDPPVIVQGTGG